MPDRDGRLELSSRILDTGVVDDPAEVGITNRLVEVADGVGFVETIGNATAVATPEGVVLIDTGTISAGPAIIAALEGWRDERVSHVVYTHGHVDHVGGSGLVARRASARGEAPPTVIGHARLPARIERYRRTDAFMLAVNRRQFLASGPLDSGNADAPLGLDRETFLPPDVVVPDVLVSDRHDLTAGGERFELRAARGESDDELWVWMPDRGVLCAGDLWIWRFPNAGNPQKALRYPADWARALREMTALEPDVLLPGHGLPMAGAARIRTALEVVAGVLEDLVGQVLTLMGSGATLDEVLQRVTIPSAVREKPYLSADYDEPEFLIHNIWREFGGWWSADPSELKPAPRTELAAELASFGGGPAALAARAVSLAREGRLRVACHLVELAAQADVDDREIHRARAEVYTTRSEAEASQMARALFIDAAMRSRERAQGSPAGTPAAG